MKRRPTLQPVQYGVSFGDIRDPEEYQSFQKGRTIVNTFAQKKGAQVFSFIKKKYGKR